MPTQLVRLAPFVLLLCASWCQAEEVTIVTQQGRTITAEVDTLTDDEALWLRFVKPSIVLRRSIAWDEVAAARVGDQGTQRWRGR